MRLLLIEDDRQIADFIATGFRQADFAVDHALDAETGTQMIETAPYDAAIIDIMLPGKNGLSVVDVIRGKGLDLPVLMLSAKQQVEDRITALERGADDYLAKPFVFAELLARVQALLRRASRFTVPTQLKCADLRMDLLQREVHRGDQPITLQPREYALLEYMLRNAGRTLSKTMIIEHIWDFHFDPQTNVVDVLVCRLRKKIDRDFPVKLVHTIRGIGYVLKEKPSDGR